MDQVSAFVYWMGTRLVLWRQACLALKNLMDSNCGPFLSLALCLSLTTESPQTCVQILKNVLFVFRSRQEVKLTRSKRN